MPNQKGLAQVLVLVLLLAGIASGVYLVQQRTNLLPKAVSGPISCNPKEKDDQVIRQTWTKLEEGKCSQSGEMKVRYQCGKKTEKVKESCPTASTPIPTPTPTPCLTDADCQTDQYCQIYEIRTPCFADGVSTTCPPQPPGQCVSKDQNCPQVITRACFAGEIYPKICKDFPSPCDVPPDWKIERDVKIECDKSKPNFGCPNNYTCYPTGVPCKAGKECPKDYCQSTR